MVAGSVVGGAGVRIRSSSANSSYGCADSNQSTGAQASGTSSANASSSGRSWCRSCGGSRSGLSESLTSSEGQNSGGESDFFHEESFE